MIDVSDGLAVDLGRLVRASDAGCNIDAAAVPVDPALVSLGEASPDIDPRALALSGGEDFELLFTIEEENLGPAVAELEPLGTPLTRIGTVEAEGRLVDGEPLEAWEERGWDHLRGR
jgi:thiamine-monophosphate kinase